MNVLTMLYSSGINILSVKIPKFRRKKSFKNTHIQLQKRLILKEKYHFEVDWSRATHKIENFEILHGSPVLPTLFCPGWKSNYLFLSNWNHNFLLLKKQIYHWFVESFEQIVQMSFFISFIQKFILSIIWYSCFSKIHNAILCYPFSHEILFKDIFWIFSWLNGKSENFENRKLRPTNTIRNIDGQIGINGFCKILFHAI